MMDNIDVLLRKVLHELWEVVNKEGPFDPMRFQTYKDAVIKAFEEQKGG